MNSWTDIKEQQIIKVLVNMGEKEPLARKITHTDGEVEYTGLAYNLWKEVKKGLEDQYKIEEVFETRYNYDEIVDNVQQGQYDIVIAPFQKSLDRIELVTFSNTLYMSKNCFLIKLNIS